MQKPVFIILTICLLVSTSIVVGSGPAGEWSLIGTYDTGSYGLESDSESRALTLRYAVGDAFRFRCEMSALNTELPPGVIPTGLGTTRYGRGGGGGAGNGNGGQGSGDPGGNGGALPAFNADGMVEGPISSSGIGDIRMAVSGKLAGGGAKLTRLDAELEVKIPTADEQKGLGTGKTDYRLGLAGEYGFWSATGFAELGWNILGDPEGYELDDVLDACIGVESEPLGVGGRVILAGWLDGNDETVEGAGRRISAGIGLRTTGALRWDIRLGSGLGGSSEDLRVSVGLSFGTAGNRLHQRGMKR